MNAHTPQPKTAAEVELARSFAAAPTEESRARAFAVFEARGLPGRRDEAWHYTDLRGRLGRVSQPASMPDAARLNDARARLEALPRIGAARFVFLDGRFVAALSDAAPQGAVVNAENRPAPATEDAVTALTLAFAGETLTIDVPARASPSTLEIVHLDGPGAIFTRVELKLGAGAKATLVERFEGGGAQTQRFAHARADLGEGAVGEWTCIVADEAAAHLETPFVRLAEGASFANFALVCGGALVRRQIDIGHAAPNARIALGGVSLIDGTRHADTTLTVRHEAPRGQSREFYRHIIADDGVGVYQGKVIVAQYAQKTDGGMKSQALLLSPTAQMNNKPELEIFADDVVCGHGATVGALDPEQIFYLQARGIAKREAEAMLLEAFGVEAIGRVADEAVAEALRERLKAWLDRRAAR